LNPEKVTLRAIEITYEYLGHRLSAKGIKILPDRISAMEADKHEKDSALNQEHDEKRPKIILQ
jgi:hypothetical protein